MSELFPLNGPLSIKYKYFLTFHDFLRFSPAFLWHRQVARPAAQSSRAAVLASTGRGAQGLGFAQRAKGDPDDDAKQRNVSEPVCVRNSDEFHTLINWLPCERNFHNTSDRRTLIYTWPQVTAMTHSSKFMATIVQLSWQLGGACL